MKLKKYQKNLRLKGFDILSYGTKVATLDLNAKEVIVLGWWSVTTSKHINYVARELGYKIVYGEEYKAG